MRHQDNLPGAICAGQRDYKLGHGDNTVIPASVLANGIADLLNHGLGAAGGRRFCPGLAASGQIVDRRTKPFLRVVLYAECMAGMEADEVVDIGPDSIFTHALKGFSDDRISDGFRGMAGCQKQDGGNHGEQVRFHVIHKGFDKYINNSGQYCPLCLELNLI